MLNDLQGKKLPSDRQRCAGLACSRKAGTFPRHYLIYLVIVSGGFSRHLIPFISLSSFFPVIFLSAVVRVQLGRNRNIKRLNALSLSCIAEFFFCKNQSLDTPSIRVQYSLVMLSIQVYFFLLQCISMHGLWFLIALFLNRLKFSILKQSKKKNIRVNCKSKLRFLDEVSEIKNFIKVIELMTVNFIVLKFKQ